MATRKKKTGRKTGVYYARRLAGLTQLQLAKKVGKSELTIKRLESAEPPPKGIKVSREWADRLAPILGVSSEDILFWHERRGENPHIESSDVLPIEFDADDPALPRGMVPELETRAGMGGGGVPSREVRRDGQHADPVKSEGWLFPPSYLREINVPAPFLLVLDSSGDSMSPTIGPSERVLVDVRHKMPTPDGVYALRDAFGAIVVKRLQLIRSKPPRLKIISDNPNHSVEDVALEEVEIVGRVLLALRRL